MRNPSSIRFSDGILFSEFLTGIFTKELPLALAKDPRNTYEQLVTIMASQLAEYLLGERNLLHPSTGLEVTVSNILFLTHPRFHSMYGAVGRLGGSPTLLLAISR